MRLITIAAPKGGSGKTTITAALAARASNDSKRIAIIDLNSDQASLTQWWYARGEPKNPRLFADVENIKDDTELLRLDGWDYVFIDTPPGSMDLIEATIMIADAVVIPVRPSILDVSSIDAVVEMCLSRHKPFSFVLSAVDSRFKKLKTAAIAALRSDGPIFRTHVTYKAHYINAMTVGKTGPETDKNLAKEIDGLWSEVKELAGKAIAVEKVGVL